jgi:hypothetical protein
MRLEVAVRFGCWVVLGFLIVACAGGASAAEILCFERWGEVSNKTTDDNEIARQSWPSGFRPSADSCRTGLLKGSIDKGDFYRIKAFYREHYRTLSTLRLWSAGGNALEAIKIGRLLRTCLARVTTPHIALDMDKLVQRLRLPSTELVQKRPPAPARSATRSLPTWCKRPDFLDPGRSQYPCGRDLHTS